jgi:hypothetical protein
MLYRPLNVSVGQSEVWSPARASDGVSVDEFFEAWLALELIDLKERGYNPINGIAYRQDDFCFWRERLDPIYVHYIKKILGAYIHARIDLADRDTGLCTSSRPCSSCARNMLSPCETVWSRQDAD